MQEFKDSVDIFLLMMAVDLDLLEGMIQTIQNQRLNICETLSPDQE